MDKSKPLIPVHHTLEEYHNRNIGMLLPIGLYLHKSIQEAPIGARITTADDKEVLLVARSELRANSDVANSLSIQLYNRKIGDLVKLMQQNWGDEMDESLILYIVVREL